MEEDDQSPSLDFLCKLIDSLLSESLQTASDNHVLVEVCLLCLLCESMVINRRKFSLLVLSQKLRGIWALFDAGLLGSVLTEDFSLAWLGRLNVPSMCLFHDFLWNPVTAIYMVKSSSSLYADSSCPQFTLLVARRT